MKASALPRTLFSDKASNNTSEKKFEKEGFNRRLPQGKV
jgi:hypothetical protein